ncbi:glycoside hydrolase family 71 protein [Stipitochalara longipes BDJ]|nr:glycoside hydrolase family 71 protein [Stipitochalara longipes BDJ]
MVQVGNVYQGHADQDIDDAKALGFSGFALNVGDPTQTFVQTTLDYMFEHAKAVGFKLYISIDLYASGNASYSSGGYTNDTWLSWRGGLAGDIFFMPDFDETDGYYQAAGGWWYYWGPVVDGIFSWETAWPARAGFGGKSPGDVSVDVPVLAGAHAHDKAYMMGLSPLQYKNSYNTNLYRQGDQNLPNDGSESHYIGNLWLEQNNDTQPGAYASQAAWPHTAWQPLVAAFNDAFLNGKSPSAMVPQIGAVAAGAMWYKTILTHSVLCPDYPGIYYEKPDGFLNGTDAAFLSVVLNPGTASGPYTVTVYSSTSSAATATATAKLVPGLNMGVSAATVGAGSQYLELKDAAGTVIMTASGGACVSSGCPNEIYNSNYQVVPLVTGKTIHACTAPINEFVHSGKTTKTCNMTYTTQPPTTLKAANTIIDNTWTASGAGTYLSTFLTKKGADGWLLNFFETVVNCGDSPGGSTFDCHDIKASSCAVPNDCTTYCPPEAFFIHESVSNLFHVYQSFYQSITNQAVIQLSSTINNISDTFAPPDTSLAELFSIVGGVLTTVAGVSTFIGDFDLDTVGAVGDGVAVFAAMFADTAIGGGSQSSETERLDEILGSTLESVFSSVNSTINKVFAPTAGNGNQKFIESFFLDGAFVDSQITDNLVDTTTQAFTCIGFGTYEETQDSGSDPVTITSTAFLKDGDLAKIEYYVPNITAAILNNYACSLTTGDGSMVWPASFNPKSLLLYPECFFNLQSMAITDPA